MKKAILCLVLSAFILVSVAASAAPGPPFVRNSASPGDVHRLATGSRGVPGLAPTTWGFVSNYTGTYYGTGYYSFRVDRTSSGTNSIYGYDFQYPSIGFVSEVRAIYAFDVAGLDGQPSPVWSSFMFDTRERPADGTTGVNVFAQIQLVSSAGSHRLQGLSFFQGFGAINLDIYDAEDFENSTPFDQPELAFLGTNNTLIGTAAIAADVVAPIDFDVTAAVLSDLGAATVPALGTLGLAVLVLLLGSAGAMLLRR